MTLAMHEPCSLPALEFRRFGAEHCVQRTNADRAKPVQIFNRRAIQLGVIGSLFRHAYRVEGPSSITVIPDLSNLAR